MICEPAASAAPGNLLEMQVLGPNPRPTESQGAFKNILRNLSEKACKAQGPGLGPQMPRSKGGFTLTPGSTSRIVSPLSHVEHYEDVGTGSPANI